MGGGEVPILAQIRSFRACRTLLFLLGYIGHILPTPKNLSILDLFSESDSDRSLVVTC